MTASSISSLSSLSSSSSCHGDSKLLERGRPSVNGKANYSKASLMSLASAAKRKRLSLTTSAAPAQNIILDGAMFDLTTSPRRRFKRRNSKCASMFYEMISPATRLELQRIAAGDQTTEAEEEPGYEITMTVPPLNDKRPKRQDPAAGEEEEDRTRWSCTQLRSQMPATPRPSPSGIACTAFPGSTTTRHPTTASTHSILAEALRLSSDHLDVVMGSALNFHNDSGETPLADEDDDDESL